MLGTEHNRQIERLVDALMVAFRVDNDRTLVGRLGTGNEVNNRQALINWTRAVLSNPDEALAEFALPILITRFEQETNDEYR